MAGRQRRGVLRFRHWIRGDQALCPGGVRREGGLREAQLRQERVFFGIVFAVIAILGFAIALPFMTYIVLAGILTYTLFPIYHFLNQRTGKPSSAPDSSIVLALLVMILPTVYLVSELVDQVSGAYTTLQDDSLQQVGGLPQQPHERPGRLSGNSRRPRSIRCGNRLWDSLRTFWGRFPNCYSDSSSCSLSCSTASAKARDSLRT